MSERILLVEDSPTQGEALRNTLGSYGFDVNLVTSGEDALESLRAAGPGEFGLVLSDVVMPGIDGYELCRRIKADSVHKDMPVVLLTSLADPMAIVRGLECGADNYVTKPYTAPYLLARVRNALDKDTLRAGSRSSMGINVKFLDTTFTITSGKEQILDLFISSIEDVVRTNDALLKSQTQLARTRKQLEEFAGRMARQAQVTAEKYSTLMHSARDAIFVLEKDGKIADSNARASQLLGENLPLLGRSLLEFVAPASKGRLSERLRALDAAAQGAEQNIEFLQSSGRGVYCDLSASRAVEGSEDLSLVILHDVTERRGYEEGLRRSAEQLAEAQAIAGMGSFEWDLVTDKISWSEEQYRIFGQRPQSFTVILPKIMECIRPEDRPMVERAVHATIEEGRPFDCEFQLTRPDNSVRHVHARGQLRQDNAGKPRNFLGTVLDITDRKQLQEQFLQSQKMEAIGQLAGGIAHDFNNLLTVIQGNSDMALSNLDPSAPAHEDISEIKRAAISAAALTRQLLAFSRRQILQPRPIQLRSVAQGVEKMLSRLIGENIELALDLDGNAGWVLGDPGQIEQVVINLAVNARDAMPGGGRITIQTTTVRLEAKGEAETQGLAPGAYERLTVSDTGIGMDKETRERIFEPFFTTKPAGRGTGLGLSTVHGIVKQSDGELHVSSELGHGTTFNIYFPQVDAPPIIESSPTKLRSRRGSETILLVEDEAPLRSLARRVLEKNGYKVLEAPNGETAIGICEVEKGRIQLVVSDVVMPGMNARIMAERISAISPGIKILFMSGYHDDDVMLRNLADARMDFLQKPFSPQDLTEKVREVLESDKVRE